MDERSIHGKSKKGKKNDVDSRPKALVSIPYIQGVTEALITGYSEDMG